MLRELPKRDAECTMLLKNPRGQTCSMEGCRKPLIYKQKEKQNKTKQKMVSVMNSIAKLDKMRYTCVGS